MSTGYVHLMLFESCHGGHEEGETGNQSRGCPGAPRIVREAGLGHVPPYIRSYHMEASSDTPVDIFQPFDIILSKIVTRLHFDQMHVLIVRVLEAV